MTVTDRDGTTRQIEFDPNDTRNLMELLREEGFEVAAFCGGIANCGTCHIAFLNGLDDLPETEEDEEFMLEVLPNAIENSRLSCQIPVKDVPDDLEIRVLGEE